jgi:F-type H+-transporting ATPase subunit b
MASDCSKAIQSRLQHVEAEITKMRQEAQAAGEHEKQEIIQKAEAFAEKSQLETSQLVEQEVRRIKKSLRGKTVDIAILMAERLLQEQITPDDQGRLAQQFVQRLGSLH